MSPPMLPSVKDSAIQGSKRWMTLGFTSGCPSEEIVQAVRPGIHQCLEPGRRAAYPAQGALVDEQARAQVAVQSALAFRLGQPAEVHRDSCARCARSHPRPGRRSCRTPHRRRSCRRRGRCPTDRARYRCSPRCALSARCRQPGPPRPGPRGRRLAAAKTGSHARPPTRGGGKPPRHTFQPAALTAWISWLTAAWASPYSMRV